MFIIVNIILVILIINISRFLFFLNLLHDEIHIQACSSSVTPVGGST